jgi:hemoglobin
MHRWVVFVFAVLLAACSSAPVRDDALYRALGQREGIARAVDAILAHVLADARINAKFRATDPAQLAPLLIDQICQAAGGPCVYRGRSMEEAHAGMKIDDAMFTAFVEDVTAGLQDAGVDAEAQQQLLGALAPMKPQIVGR